MESIIIRLTFLISLIYVIYSYINGAYYETYLIKSILIFIGLSLLFLFVQFFVLKHLIIAKKEVVKEELKIKFAQLKEARDRRKVIQDEAEKRIIEEELAEKKEKEDKKKKKKKK